MISPNRLRSALGLFALLAVIALLPWPASAAESRLAEFLGKVQLHDIMPKADRLGPVEGTPPAAAAYQGDTLVGYVFLNSDVVNATGYSGRPINLVLGIDTSGTITGAKLVEHHEPIVLIGIPEQKIRGYIDGFIGSNPIAGTFPAGHGPDIISGATVTVMVLGDTISKSAVRIAVSRGLAGLTPQAAASTPRRRIDEQKQGVATWEQLLGDGSVRRLLISVADVNRDFAASSDPRAAQRPEPGPDDDTFIDLYVGLASAPVIGRSLLGEDGYQALRQRLAPDQQAIVVMGRGRYSFRGSGYVRGGIFDRIQMVQDRNTIRFRDRDYQRLGRLAAAGAPDFPEIVLFTIPAGTDFDPAQDWRLTLLIQRAVGALDKAFITADLSYRLPDGNLTAPPPAPTAGQTPAVHPEMTADGGEPLWVKIWKQRTLDIAILGVALFALTLIFFFQDWLVRRPRLSGAIRSTFLMFTLLWIGWYANAQMSVVNILTLANALASGFRWDYFLMDPLIFILWCATAAALLFWGRGAYCGWLCPFGALQEFANRLARRLKVPQLVIPWGLHERLWPIKYIVFLGLFAFSLYSLSDAERMAEIEPFKTAIILKFARNWPFVVYAAGLVGTSFFVERFFCRYLCPLGAGLAIPARIRMFDWLKRYRECGSPCQRCSNECPVQSIHPDGRINPNECIYCMHCQELYWDDHRCPVMIQRRLKRERLQSAPAPRQPVAGQAHPTTSGGTEHVG